MQTGKYYGIKENREKGHQCFKFSSAPLQIPDGTVEKDHMAYGINNGQTHNMWALARQSSKSSRTRKRRILMRENIDPHHPEEKNIYVTIETDNINMSLMIEE